MRRFPGFNAWAPAREGNWTGAGFSFSGFSGLSDTEADAAEAEDAEEEELAEGGAEPEAEAAGVEAED